MQKQLFSFSMLIAAGEKTKGLEGRNKLKGAEGLTCKVLSSVKVNELLINWCLQKTSVVKIVSSYSRSHSLTLAILRTTIKLYVQITS